MVEELSSQAQERVGSILWSSSVMECCKQGSDWSHGVDYRRLQWSNYGVIPKKQKRIRIGAAIQIPRG